MKSIRLALSFFELSSMLGCCQWISTPSKSTSSIIRATLLIIDWIAEVGENSFVDIVRERIRRNRPPFWELINFKCATISVKIKKKKDNDDACYHLLYSRTRNRPNLAIDWKSRQLVVTLLSSKNLHSWYNILPNLWVGAAWGAQI